MIFTDRIITVRKGESKINEPIIVYRGDYELEVRFTIMNSKFKFMSGTNLIESENATYGQLAILTPYGGNIFSDVAKCNNGTVTFVLTKAMLDQIEEVGLYSFQIRLFDYNKESRVSIPPVEFGIEVREPITSEDHDNSVNNAIVGYSIAKIADALNEDVGDTFNSNGDYNKTIWETGDRITEGKLNKIEDAIDTINQNEINDKNTLNKQMTSNFNVLQSQIDNVVIESGNTDAEVAQARGEYNLLNQRLNAMDETDAELVSQLDHIENDINFMSVESFGAKGDGVTDDTQAIQDAINSDYPIEFSNKTYIVDNINFNKSKYYMFRSTTIKTNVAGSEVVTVSTEVHFAGRVSINANNRKNYAMVFENGGRSYFENVGCTRALMYGLLCTSARGGNVNISTFNQLRVSVNGCEEIITNYTYDSNISTIQITFPISIFRDKVGDTFSKYVFVIDDVINPVSSYTTSGDNYVITFKNAITSENPIIKLLSGGGLMMEGSDCGVFNFNTIDCISNKGVGVRLTSLYGHTFNNLCIQGAYIGVLLGRYYRNSPVNNSVFIKPYFELITAKDIMTESITANLTVIQPIGGTCESLFYPGNNPENFLVFNNGGSNIAKQESWGINPGARTLKNHQFNYVSYSDNSGGEHSIKLSVSDYCNPKFLFIGGGNAKSLVFTSDDGTLVNGATTYTLPVNNQMFRLVAVARFHTGWRVMEIGKCQTLNTTTKRPNTPNTGDCHYDTTLKKPIWWNGSSWIDATGTTV